VVPPELANTPKTAPLSDPVAPAIFPAPGTPEWRELNHRRAKLIDKEIDGLLTEAEREEYEYLQRSYFEAAAKANPLPMLDLEHLEQLVSLTRRASEVLLG